MPFTREALRQIAQAVIYQNGRQTVNEKGREKIAQYVADKVFHPATECPVSLQNKEFAGLIIMAEKEINHRIEEEIAKIVKEKVHEIFAKKMTAIAQTLSPAKEELQEVAQKALNRQHALLSIDLIAEHAANEAMSNTTQPAIPTTELGLLLSEVARKEAEDGHKHTEVFALSNEEQFRKNILEELQNQTEQKIHKQPNLNPQNQLQQRRHRQEDG